MRAKFVKVHRLSVVENLDSRLLLRVLTDFSKGDLSARLPVDSTGVPAKIYDTIKEIIDLNARLTKELGRISAVVGREGKIRHRVSLPGATGGWADCVDSVNRQAAFEKQRILLTEAPSDYIELGSALGEAPPVKRDCGTHAKP